VKYRYVCIGGTFDLLHKGHKKLITRAFSLGERVLIGVTSDEFKKEHEVEPYSERHKNLIKFLQQKGLMSRVLIEKINDPYSSAMLPNLEAIVVSEETEPSAERLNQMRKGRGLKTLKIEQISWVRAENGSIISSTAIRKGIMDREGRLVQKG
jgi:pantetheine-phosphate adenylyltransferase